MFNSVQPYGLYSPWNSPGQNTGVGSFSLLQGIFPTQGSNPGLPHCGRILYQLSNQGSPEVPQSQWRLLGGASRGWATGGQMSTPGWAGLAVDLGDHLMARETVWDEW